MNFVQTTKELPRYNESVVVRDLNGFYFSAKFQIDEDGDYWVYDLPSGVALETEVKQDIISWSYID